MTDRLTPAMLRERATKWAHAKSMRGTGNYLNEVCYLKGYEAGWKSCYRANRLTKAEREVRHAEFECARVELELLERAIECNDPKAQLLIRVADILKTVERAKGRK